MVEGRRIGGFDGFERDGRAEGVEGWDGMGWDGMEERNWVLWGLLRGC